MLKKGDNRLVPGLYYMVDVLKFPNQAPRVSGESLQMCVAWHCPDGTQHLFCWHIRAISGQSDLVSVLRLDTVQSRLLYALHRLYDYLPLRQMLQGCLRNPPPAPILKEHLTFAALFRAI
ncbi:hypothetical protein TNCV_1450681 [Trichonephila clavipes]|nr:hypothetical protein TNCV_1450681 [Trichonephila clavipes]